MLQGKTALITGSTSGIGLATARELAKSGADIVLHGLMDDHDGQAMARQLADEFGIRTMFNGANLADAGAIADFMDTAIAEMGGIDILVNNAGIQHTQDIIGFPADKWHAILAINLSSAFFTMQKALPKMQQNQWGRIINIASVHGLVASVNKSAYCAAKHGIVGLTKVAALENAANGVTANAICPGWVDTPLINSQIQDFADKNDMSFDQAKVNLVTTKQPMPTMANPSQIGELILFLCSEAAGSITGASLPVDGGWTAQ